MGGLLAHACPHRILFRPPCAIKEQHQHYDEHENEGKHTDSEVPQPDHHHRLVVINILMTLIRHLYLDRLTGVSELAYRRLGPPQALGLIVRHIHVSCVDKVACRIGEYHWNIRIVIYDLEFKREIGVRVCLGYDARRLRPVADTARLHLRKSVHEGVQYKQRCRDYHHGKSDKTGLHPVVFAAVISHVEKTRGN